MVNRIFTLEALAARHGDCLLLHWGDSDNPNLIMIDGGAGKTYELFLRKRLNQLRQSRQDPLQLDLIMVSHIDDDHINGVLDVLGRYRDLLDTNKEPTWVTDDLWVNTLDDIVGNGNAQSAEVLSFGGLGSPSDTADAPAVIASVNQGRKLRDMANALSLTLNGGDDLITGGYIWDMGGGLTFQIVGPMKSQIDEFREAWDKELIKKGWNQSTGTAEIAAFMDKSPWNLASTVILAKVGTKTMLLTGDARGDHIVEGLQEGGLLTGSSMSVDILKVPHHGSDNNVSTDFFRRIKANHYVVSGNGNHGNPEMATLQMIVDARGNDEYKVHCTYRDGKHHLGENITEFLNRQTLTTRNKFEFRDDASLSIKVDLGTSKMVD